MIWSLLTCINKWIDKFGAVVDSATLELVVGSVTKSFCFYQGGALQTTHTGSLTSSISPYFLINLSYPSFPSCIQFVKWVFAYFVCPYYYDLVGFLLNICKLITADRIKFWFNVSQWWNKISSSVFHYFTHNWEYHLLCTDHIDVLFLSVSFHDEPTFYVV